MLFGIDTDTLFAIFSGLFTLILAVFAVFQIRSSKQLAMATEKVASAMSKLDATTNIVGEHAKALTTSTTTFVSAIQSLSLDTEALVKIESEPRLEYIQKQKDLKLGGVEFELVNKGKGAAHSVKVTPVSAKGIRIGVSLLNIQRTDITVGEARSYLLTSVKQGDLISLTVEYKDSFGRTCVPQTFGVDTS